MHVTKKLWAVSAIAVAAGLGAAALAEVSLSQDVNLPPGTPEWKAHFAVDPVPQRPGEPALAIDNPVRFQATYKGRVAGLDIGRIHITTDIGDATYRMDYAIEQKGVAAWFDQTRTDSVSIGTIDGLDVTSLYYLKQEDEGDDYQNVELVRAGPGSRFELWSDPQYDLYWPVPEAYALDTVDPIGGQLILGFAATPEGADPCDRTVKVFDGKRRWDMVSSYDGETRVRARSGDGYSGDAIKCRLTQKRVAGFKPEKIAESMPDGAMYLVPIPEELQTENFTYFPAVMEGNYGIINARLEAENPTITGPDGTVYDLTR